MTLETYKTLYMVFLVATIVLFILSVVFFFVFDIRKIFSIKNGRAMRKSVKELNKINRNEDNRNRKKYKGRSMQLSKELTGETGKVTDDLPPREEKTMEVEGSTFVTAPLDGEPTVTLKQVNDVLEPETGILIRPEAEGEKPPMPVIEEPVIPEQLTGEKRFFQIVERKVVIFANEVIQNVQ